jgi:hypothetical protein
MPGFYRAVAKPRAYLLLPVELGVREESRCRRWQIPPRFARTKQSRDERGRVSRSGFTFMRHALYLERTQQLVRGCNVAATFAMGVNDSTPTVPCEGAAQERVKTVVAASNSSRATGTPHNVLVSVALLLAVLGSGTPVGEVTVAVFESDPVSDALIVPLAL